MLAGHPRDIEVFLEVVDDRTRMEISFMPIQFVAIEKMDLGQFFCRQNRLEPFPDQRGQTVVFHNQDVLVVLQTVQNEQDDIINIMLCFFCQIKDVAPGTVPDLQCECWYLMFHAPLPFPVLIRPCTGSRRHWDSIENVVF